MKLVLGSLLLLALPLLAEPPQGRPPGPWWESSIINSVNLSDSQRKQIQSITKEYRDRLIELRGAVDKAEGEMTDLFNDGTYDDHRASDAVERLIRARSDLTREFSFMTLKIRAVLTSDQWQELQRRSREVSRRRGGPPDKSAPGSNSQSPKPAQQ